MSGTMRFSMDAILCDDERCSKASTALMTSRKRIHDNRHDAGDLRNGTPRKSKATERCRQNCKEGRTAPAPVRASSSRLNGSCSPPSYAENENDDEVAKSPEEAHMAVAESQLPTADVASSSRQLSCSAKDTSEQLSRGNTPSQHSSMHRRSNTHNNSQVSVVIFTFVISIIQLRAISEGHLRMLQKLAALLLPLDARRGDSLKKAYLVS